MTNNMGRNSKKSVNSVSIFNDTTIVYSMFVYVGPKNITLEDLH